jgi:hypothetical protein
MDWAATDSFSQANHPPVVVVNNQPGSGALFVTFSPDSALTLDASASTDTDGDTLSYQWTVLGDSSTCAPHIQSNGAFATVNVPVACTPQGSIHVLLSVQDSGTPPLSRYRRIILTQRAPAAQPGLSSVLPPDGAEQQAP